jgi:beta-glucosidase
VVGLDGSPGFTCQIYEKGSSQPTTTRHGHTSSEISLLDGIEGTAVTNGDVALIGTFIPPQSAKYYLTLSSLGPSQLVINDSTIYQQTDNCSDPMGFLFGGVPVPRLSFDGEAGKQYKIHIKTSPPIVVEDEEVGILAGQIGLRLGLVLASDHDKDVLTEAIELAKAADYAIVFTGHEPEWETEGQDQAGFNLPKDGSQDRLVEGIAAANPNTIVVNSTGVAVALPWLDQVRGLLQTWFPGQEAGNSIADVISGAQNPEGHLTCTFPKRLEDCPAYGNFPGEYINRKLRVKYAEGVFVGYRHFDRLPADKVNFPFGFGLSYTSFAYSDIAIREVPEDEYLVSVSVSNTGAVKGATAVQVYVGNASQKPEDPVKVLAGFKKVTLEAGASATIEVPVKARDFAFWSEEERKWVVDAGVYNFSVGRNAGELVATTGVEVLARNFAP